MVLFCRVLVVVFLLATAASTLRVYPHQLAYFNEVSGGPENGYRHLLHSNFDWGQDLLFLRQKLEEPVRSGSAPVLLHVHLFYDPGDLGIRCRRPTGLAGKDDLRPVAFGVTTLLEEAADLQSSAQALSAEFAQLPPSYRAGHTIWVYE